MAWAKRVGRMSGGTRAWPRVGSVSVSLSWNEPASQVRPELCFLLLLPPVSRGWGSGWVSPEDTGRGWSHGYLQTLS